MPNYLPKLIFKMLLVFFFCFESCTYNERSNVTTEQNAITQIPLRAATNFSVKKDGAYTLIEIGKAWPDAKEHFTYLLYPKEQDPPQNYPAAMLIPVPVERIVCTGTSQLAILDALGATDKIVGVANGQYIYNAELRKRLEDKTLTNLGNDKSFDYEKLLALDPELIFAFSSGNSQQLKKFKNLGFPVVLLSEFMEETPLGRAEWMRFVAYFIGKEAEAKKQLDKLFENYNTLKETLITETNKPKILTGAAQGSTWYIAGGQSFIAALIKDAGGDYIWAANKDRGGVPLDFEVVLSNAEHANIWLNVNLSTSLSDLVQMDQRYESFEAYQKQQVFNYTARVSANGGYDFFESAIVRPDLVLKDLALIFYGDTIAQQELYYYQKLK